MAKFEVTENYSGYVRGYRKYLVEADSEAEAQAHYMSRGELVTDEVVRDDTSRSDVDVSLVGSSIFDRAEGPAEELGDTDDIDVIDQARDIVERLNKNSQREWTAGFYPVNHQSWPCAISTPYCVKYIGAGYVAEFFDTVPLTAKGGTPSDAWRALQRLMAAEGIKV